MSDNDELKYYIRELERKVDELNRQVYELKQEVYRSRKDLECEVRNGSHELNRKLWQSSNEINWNLIKMFSGVIFIIVFTILLMMPMMLAPSPPPQNITIQMPKTIEQQAPPVEQKAVEQKAVETERTSSVEEKAPTVEQKTEQPIEQTEPKDETTSTEQKVSVRHYTRESFLGGIFEDMKTTFEQALMLGVVIMIFKLVVE